MKKKDRYKDFTRTLDGEYIYNGKLLNFDETETTYKGFIMRILSLCLADLSSIIAAGFLKVPGMINDYYVIIPYAISVLLHASCMWGVCRIVYWKNPLRAYIYEETVKSVPRRCIFASICSILTFILYIYCIICNGIFGFKQSEVLLFACFVLFSSVFSLLLKKILEKSRWI